LWRFLKIEAGLSEIWLGTFEGRFSRVILKDLNLLSSLSREFSTAEPLLLKYAFLNIWKWKINLKI
jgi:hypothetical protein